MCLKTLKFPTCFKQVNNTYIYIYIYIYMCKLELESRMMGNHLARFKEHFIIS
jgi:hypothetical protein